MKIKFENGALFWVIKKGVFELEIEIKSGEKSGLLYAPDKVDMIPKVKEYLDGEISFRLKKNNKTILEKNSKQTAVEIIGKTERLIKNVI